MLPMAWLARLGGLACSGMVSLGGGAPDHPREGKAAQPGQPPLEA